MSKITDGLPIEEKFIIAGPHGEIIESAINEAEEAVRKFAEQSSKGATFQFPSPRRLWDNGNGWNVWMVDKGKYSGTWAKRYSSLVWQQFHCRPPENLVAKLGEILSRFANCEQQYTVDVTNDFDWTPGTFGESSGSCWWGEWNHARTGLQSNGGLALRFYHSNGKGSGRCWIYPEKDRLYIFNAYHKDDLSLYNMACLLSTHMGLSYKKVNLEIPRAYINGDCGFCVAPADIISQIGRDECCQLDFADEEEDLYECEDCGRTHPDGWEGWYYCCGNRICERCYENHYFTCQNCGDIYGNDDHLEDNDGNFYCQNCFDDKFVSCSECSTAIEISDAIEVDGNQYCDSCAPDKCDECGERNFDLTDGLCSDCFDKKESEDDSKSA
jgi:hypothetical protein